ncbi:MAG: four-carbon acid sugar kinase family protein, partial [Anaerolineae bacterium]|nr:four-carbon acid sugar kinase family protein [Anaerolineae bacterium]
QIDDAIARGFCGIRLDSIGLTDPATADVVREGTVTEALEALERGQSVVLYSAQGPDDPVIAATKAHLAALGLTPERLGAQQGLILRELIQRKTDLKRLCVAGGDTGGHAVRQLGIFALEVIAPLAPGGPLCRVSAHEARFDGLEIVLKGGQVGQPDFYDVILRGSA